MDSLVVQVLLGFVIYLVGTLVTRRLVGNLHSEIARLALVLIAFALITTAFFLIQDQRFRFLSIVCAFVAFMAINSGRTEGPEQGRLEYWFGRAAAAIMSGVKLRGDINKRLLMRLARTSRRQGSTYTSSIDSDLAVRRSTNPLYWQYDVNTTCTYRVEDAERTNIRIQIRPTFVDRDSSGNPVRSRTVSFRADQAWDKWSVPYVSPVFREDWHALSTEVSVRAYQQQSTDLSKMRLLTMKRHEVHDGDKRPRASKGAQDASISSASPELLEFTSNLALDGDWNMLTVEISNIPHLCAVPVLYFYAWDLCDGVWDFRLSLEDHKSTVGPFKASHEIVRAVPITSADIGVELDQRANFAEARFHASNVAIVPDDAIVIVLRPDGSVSNVNSQET